MTLEEFIFFRDHQKTGPILQVLVGPADEQFSSLVHLTNTEASLSLNLDTEALPPFPCLYPGCRPPRPTYLRLSISLSSTKLKSSFSDLKRKILGRDINHPLHSKLTIVFFHWSYIFWYMCTYIEYEDVNECFKGSLNFKESVIFLGPLSVRQSLLGV